MHAIIRFRQLQINKPNTHKCVTHLECLVNSNAVWCAWISDGGYNSTNWIVITCIVILNPGEPKFNHDVENLHRAFLQICWPWCHMGIHHTLPCPTDNSWATTLGTRGPGAPWSPLSHCCLKRKSTLHSEYYSAGNEQEALNLDFEAEIMNFIIHSLHICIHLKW